jgi:glycerol-3-phosphate acyltransferase PlsX
MTIAIDMMGGDFAPLEAVKGVGHYLSEQDPSANLALVGDEAALKPLLQENKVSGDRVKIVHAEQVIEMHEQPTKALKEKQRSSIAIGFHLLATGKADAFVSAGNTGAMLVGALFTIKAVEGVLRPTISSVIPKENGGTGLLLDVGLNADCKPEQLNQFAVMGSVYAQLMLVIDNPRVGLINVGEEEGKGNILAGNLPIAQRK